MTKDQATNVAIAEALGWKKCREDWDAALRIWDNPDTPLIGTPPCNQNDGWESRDSFWLISNYTGSLDALRPVEIALDDKQYHTFTLKLSEIAWQIYPSRIEDSDYKQRLRASFSASALNRAEALVATLNLQDRVKELMDGQPDAKTNAEDKP